MEVLQGSRNDLEWQRLSGEIAKLHCLPIAHDCWEQAARLFFELQRGGVTIRSSIDCIIALTGIRENCTLLHNDRDFDAIATVRPLKHIRIDVSKATP